MTTAFAIAIFEPCGVNSDVVRVTGLEPARFPTGT